MNPHDLVSSLDDAKPIREEWGELRWLVSGALMPGASQTVGVVRIDPGHANPLHLHPNCDEVLYVLQGGCLHRLGDEELPLGVGAVIRIPAGVPHRARCTTDDALLAVIAFSTGDRQTVAL